MPNKDAIYFDGDGFYKVEWEDLGNRDRENKIPVECLNADRDQLALLSGRVAELEAQCDALLNEINALRWHA
jgi:hypothetical protein